MGSEGIVFVFLVFMIFDKLMLNSCVDCVKFVI